MKTSQPTIDIRQQWATTLADLRKMRGYTIREFANMCGYSATTIVNIEQCKFSPRIEVVEQMLSALGYRLTVENDIKE